MAEAAAWLKAQELSCERIEKGACKTHVFTHVEWQMESYRVFCKMKNDRFLWVTREALEDSVMLPAAFKKFTDAFVF